MAGIILQIMLLLQGIPVPPNQGGTVTGILTTEASRPAAGIRVAVMLQPESLSDVANVSSLVSIAETDEAGRFRLENIPPGRYYIAAGRVEGPTYYPGTTEIAAGKILTIASGDTVSGVDFVMKDVSDRGLETIHAMLRIPIQIHIEDDVRIPVFSERGKVQLRLTHFPDGGRTDVPLDSPILTLPIATGDYQVGIENLPDDYSVKSLSYGSINLLNDKMKVTLADLPRPEPGERMLLTATQTGIELQRRIPASNVVSSPQVVVLGSILSKSDLTLTLSKTTSTAPAVPGVQVRGRVEYAGQQEVYLSGVPGTLYADGTFEFRGVPAGRHVVAMLGSTSTSRQFGAVITVGSSDVENLLLLDTIALPLDILSPRAEPAGAIADSSHTTMHSIHGHVVEESTHHPVAGIVTFRGYARSMTYSLPTDGEFEISNLLPGTYGLKIQTFESTSLDRTIVVGNEDLDLNLSVR